MISTALREIAVQNRMNIQSGCAYGMLNGCIVTLSGGTDYQRISIYVGAQEQPASGYDESYTVSCARQIIHTISAASGEENVYSLITGNEALPALVLNHAGSVVTVNFAATPAGDAGVVRFVAEILPQVSALTRPQQCIYCTHPTGGEGVPVRLAEDTVVPMHDGCLQQAAEGYARQHAADGSKAGVWGAVIGAAAGALIWAMVYHLIYPAAILCVLIGLLASRGYDLFKGRPGMTKVITVALISLAAVLIGAFAGSLLPYFDSFASLGETTKHMFEELSASQPGWLTYIRANISNPDQGYWTQLLVKLILGGIFDGIGCLDLLRQKDAFTAEASKPRRMKGKA